MTDPNPADRGESLTWTAITELDELRSSRVELDARIAAQAEHAVRGLRLHVAERELTDDRFSPALVKRLYWDCPDVKVADIAAALGMRSPREVIAAAGSGHFAEPCRDGCGTTVERTVKSRSDASSSGHSHAPWTDPRRCPDCQAKRLEEYQRNIARSRAEYAEEDRARLETLARIRAEGVQPTARYVEYPGIGGTYLDPDFRPSADV